jgi:hypothetical protein
MTRDSPAAFCGPCAQYFEPSAAWLCQGSLPTPKVALPLIELKALAARRSSNPSGAYTESSFGHSMKIARDHLVLSERFFIASFARDVALHSTWLT